MPKVKRWIESEVQDGCVTVRLRSWRYFFDYVYQEMLDYETFIWRGHRCDNWLLEPTIDRLVKGAKLRPNARANFHHTHLDRFRYAVRGRRGPNPTTINDENDWWALGQHNGLATPLLDWTNSPFVAAYFAFVGVGLDQTTRRAVFALHQPSVEEKAFALWLAAENARHEKEAQAPEKNKLVAALTRGGTIRREVEFIRPMSDENARLVNQGGLFTRAPDGVDLEAWVKQQFKGENNYILIKITIPDRDRVDCLRSLNRMNINHLTLFPDLYGASKHCNHAAQIDRY